MALSQIGNVAGEAAHDAGTARPCEPAAPRPTAVPTAAPLSAALLALAPPADPHPGVPAPAEPPAEPPAAEPPAVARAWAARRLAAGPVAAGGGAADDTLLEAVRRGLVPGDPVARLLAGWSAPPVRPVAATPVARREPAL